jgi:hypothetical protein
MSVNLTLKFFFYYFFFFTLQYYSKLLNYYSITDFKLNIFFRISKLLFIDKTINKEQIKINKIFFELNINNNSVIIIAINN